MKNIIYYKTVSYGGEEGRTLETRKFETEQLARENALNDTRNSGFSLYKVTMVFNGAIAENEEFIGRIGCGYDKIQVEYMQKDISLWKQQIEKIRNNKRMKEENKIKEIRAYENAINKTLEKIANIISVDC